MAITFVQSASALGTGNVSIAFGSDNTAGNVIIAAGSVIATGQAMTLSDTQGNSYSTVVPFNNNSSTCESQIFFAFNIKAGPNTVTFFPGVASSSSIAIHEFSGIDTIDQLASNAGIGNAQDSTGATTTKANELLFGFTGGSGSTVNSITQGAGFTLAERHVDNSGSIVSFLTQWQIVSSLGTYNSTSTTTVGKGGSYDWGAEIETFFSSVITATTTSSVIKFGF